MKEVEIQELCSLILQAEFLSKAQSWVGLHPTHLASTCVHHTVMARVHTSADTNRYVSTIGLMMSSQEFLVETDPRIHRLKNLDGVAGLGIFQYLLLTKPNISCLSVLFCVLESCGLDHAHIFISSRLIGSFNIPLKEALSCLLKIDLLLHVHPAPGVYLFLHRHCLCLDSLGLPAEGFCMLQPSSRPSSFPKSLQLVAFLHFYPMP